MPLTLGAVWGRAEGAAIAPVGFAGYAAGASARRACNGRVSGSWIRVTGALSFAIPASDPGSTIALGAPLSVVELSVAAAVIASDGESG